LPCMAVLLVSTLILVWLDILRRTDPARVLEFAGGDPVEDGGAATASGNTLTAVRVRSSTPRLTVVDRWVGVRVPANLRSAAAAAWTRRLEVTVLVVAVVAALVTLYVVFQTGESGARAAWGGGR
jgi:hypothetical protein